MPDKDDKARLKLAEKALRYSFRDKSLLRAALTHPSLSKEGFDGEVYERLEFLGDAVLGFIVADLLYREFPEFAEGEMSKLKAAIVAGRTWASLASDLRLGDAVIMTPGAERTGGRTLTSTLADVFEAVVGAMYLDRGLEETRAFVLPLVKDQAMQDVLAGTWRDWKSLLQELTMAEDGSVPEYRIVGSAGPDHARSFTAEVLVRGVVEGVGSGSSKKDAEKCAAESAFRSLSGEDQG